MTTEKIKLHVKRMISFLAPETTQWNNLINDIINQNTFKNPLFKEGCNKFWCKKKIPENIYSVYIQNRQIYLHRGYGNLLKVLFKSHGIEYEIQDERVNNPVVFPDALHGVVLRDYQEACIAQALRVDQGLFVSPTGSGKSIIGLEIIRRRAQKTLIIVHRSDLARQWQEIIKKLLGIDAPIIGNGKFQIGEKITIGLIQSLANKKEECEKLANEIGLVLVDEAHHIPAVTFCGVLNRFPARCRFGLSATPERADGLMELIFRTIGPVLYRVQRDDVLDSGSIVHAEVQVIKTNLDGQTFNSWNEYLDGLSNDASRNLMIILMAKNFDSPVLILTDRKAHADLIGDMLTRRGIEHVVAHGSKKNRLEIMEKIRVSPITVGTTSLVGEGLDISAWTNLIIATPISSYIKLMQAVGRVIRPCDGKNKAIIIDLVDNCAFSKSSFNKRFDYYKSANIFVKFNG